LNTGTPMPAVLRSWLAEPLPEEVARALDRLAGSEDVVRIAVMPDVHLASGVCIGTVIATHRLIYPQAVGGDIGCGIATIPFDCTVQTLADERTAARLLAGLYDRVPAIRHPPRSAVAALPAALMTHVLGDPRLEKSKGRDGRVEFATIGRGNHFVELQADDEDRLWLAVHSGSRAMGQAITAAHLRNARKTDSGLSVLDAETAAGEAYLADLRWAREYARANRAAIIEAVSDLLREVLGAMPRAEDRMDCDHNHVQRETHFGAALWVHRKGAVPAGAGEPGIIPGSMGAPTYHTQGRGCTEALGSSSHGAGRSLSRATAFRKITSRDLLRQMRGVWFDQRRADRLRDEAPAAYKDIGQVMRAQHDLTRIVRRLRPVLSYKGA
jgi:tRNA-splicing ligase RtcB